MVDRLTEKQRLVSLSSGGSTLKAINEAILGGELSRTALVGVVVAKDADKEKAVKNGIPEEKVLVISPAPQIDFPERLIQAIKPLNPDLIGQYGWDVLTPREFLEEFSGINTINQHPGNPRYFGGYGMSCAPRVHAATLMVRRKIGFGMYTDVVAQRIDPEFDGGAVYKRGLVPIIETDDVDRLQSRAIKTEWRIQINTLRDFEEGRAWVEDPEDEVDPLLEERPRTIAIAKMIARCIYTPAGELIDNPNFQRAYTLIESPTPAEIIELKGYLEPQ